MECPSFGVGHVLQFEVKDDFLAKFDVQKVGLDHHLEYWIPAEELDQMNQNITGRIKLVNSFK